MTSASSPYTKCLISQKIKNTQHTIHVRNGVCICFLSLSRLVKARPGMVDALALDTTRVRQELKVSTLLGNVVKPTSPLYDLHACKKVSIYVRLAYVYGSEGLGSLSLLFLFPCAPSPNPKPQTSPPKKRATSQILRRLPK